MTYIIGWKKNNSVFLSGDIAITRKSKLNLRNTQSIFGGELVNKVDLSVNEECLKIFKINNKVIASFAGDVSLALEVIKQLKSYVDEDDPLPMIKFIIERINPLDDFSIFLGVVDKENNAGLYSYNLMGDNKFLEHEEPIQDGSLGSKYQKFTTDFCNAIVEEEISDSDILAIVNTVHQNLIIQDNLLEKSVGGIFFGLRISPDEVRWQDDTTLVIYKFKEGEEENESNNPDLLFDFSAFVGIVERDNAIRYSSPFPNGSFARSVIYNCLDIPNTIEEFIKKKDMVIDWHKKWFNETNEVFNTAKSKYYGFISRSTNLTPKIAIFSKESLEKLNVKIEILGSGAFELVSVGQFIKLVRPTNENANYSILIGT